MSHPNTMFDSENAYEEDIPEYPDYDREEVMLVSEWFIKRWISQREYSRLVAKMF